MFAICSLRALDPLLPPDRPLGAPELRDRLAVRYGRDGEPHGTGVAATGPARLFGPARLCGAPCGPALAAPRCPAPNFRLCRGLAARGRCSRDRGAFCPRTWPARRLARAGLSGRPAMPGNVATA